MIKYFLFRMHTVQILFYPFVLIAETKHLQTTKYVITQPRDPSCACVYLYQVRGITLVCASITTLKWGAKRGSENDGRHFLRILLTQDCISFTKNGETAAESPIKKTVENKIVEYMKLG